MSEPQEIIYVRRWHIHTADGARVCAANTIAEAAAVVTEALESGEMVVSVYVVETPKEQS